MNLHTFFSSGFWGAFLSKLDNGDAFKVGLFRGFFNSNSFSSCWFFLHHYHINKLSMKGKLILENASKWECCIFLTIACWLATRRSRVNLETQVVKLFFFKLYIKIYQTFWRLKINVKTWLWVLAHSSLDPKILILNHHSVHADQMFIYLIFDFI